MSRVQGDVYFDFDIEMDSEEEDYRLLFDLPLRNNFKPRIGKGIDEVKHLGIPRFRNLNGKKCLLMEPASIVREGKNKTQQKSNLISIPSYGNIKTKSGKIALEISPLNITNKQYIFMHNVIQYPSTTISIWIEDGRVYRHDIRGIQEIKDIELVNNKWNYLNIDFKGSFYIADNFYIGDGLHAYIRNLKVYKK